MSLNFIPLTFFCILTLLVISSWTMWSYSDVKNEATVSTQILKISNLTFEIEYQPGSNITVRGATCVTHTNKLTCGLNFTTAQFDIETESPIYIMNIPFWLQTYYIRIFANQYDPKAAPELFLVPNSYGPSNGRTTTLQISPQTLNMFRLTPDKQVGTIFFLSLVTVGLAVLGFALGYKIMIQSRLALDYDTI